MTSTRFVFLDVIRGIAVLWMIQVHITNSFLDPALRHSPFFDVLNISNGYVAPTFIFCAGAGFWIAIGRKMQAYLEGGTVLRGYLRRLFYILWCGYVLHVPFYSLDRMLIATRAEVMPGLQVDVLHTIVFSSLLALCIVFATKSVVRMTTMCGIAALTIMFTSWIAYVIGTPPDSPFPLLPWSTYFFAGVYLTGTFMTSTQKDLMAKRWVALGIVGPFVLFFLHELPFAMPWESLWWKASPSILLFRLCATMLLFGGLYLMEKRLQVSRVATFLQRVGQESLLMYVAHLLIVYGHGADLIRDVLHIHDTGFLGVAAIYIVITIPLLFFMWWWHDFKKRSPDMAVRVLTAQIIGMTLFFILIPADFHLW
ncbi:hypothetical protein BH10BAC6_BH10BAC6_07500 [soil metagenome]